MLLVLLTPPAPVVPVVLDAPALTAPPVPPLAALLPVPTVSLPTVVPAVLVPDPAVDEEDPAAPPVLVA
jgi:hypothetical protein